MAESERENITWLDKLSRGWIAAFGLTMIQVGEYAAAILAFSVTALLLCLRSARWRVSSGTKRLARALTFTVRAVSILGIAAGLALSIYWANQVKGASLWSHLLGPKKPAANLNAAIRAGLGELLSRNADIRETCERDQPPSTFSCWDEWIKWRDDARSYISNNMEPSYLARFRSTIGTHMEYKTDGGRFLQGKDSDAVNLLTFCANTLEQFIKEFAN